MSTAHLQEKLNQKLRLLQDKKKIVKNLKNLELFEKDVQEEIERITPEKRKFEEWARYFGSEDAKTRQVLKWFNDELKKLSEKAERAHAMRTKILAVQEQIDYQIQHLNVELDQLRTESFRMPIPVNPEQPPKFSNREKSIPLVFPTMEKLTTFPNEKDAAAIPDSLLEEVLFSKPAAKQPDLPAENESSDKSMLVERTQSDIFQHIDYKEIKVDSDRESQNKTKYNFEEAPKETPRIPEKVTSQEKKSEVTAAPEQRQFSSRNVDFLFRTIDSETEERDDFTNDSPEEATIHNVPASPVLNTDYINIKNSQKFDDPTMKFSNEETIEFRLPAEDTQRDLKNFRLSPPDKKEQAPEADKKSVDWQKAFENDFLPPPVNRIEKKEIQQPIIQNKVVESAPRIPKSTEFDEFEFFEKSLNRQPAGKSDDEHKINYIKNQPVRPVEDINLPVQPKSQPQKSEQKQAPDINLKREEPELRENRPAMASPVKNEPLFRQVSSEKEEIKVAPPKPVAESPKRVVEPPKPVAESPKRVVEPPKPVVESPKRVVEPPKPVVESPKRVVEPPKAVVEPPKAVVEPPGIQIPKLNRSDILYLGIDLGTYETTVAASNGEIATTVSAVGWPKDIVSLKMLRKDVLVGEEALRNKLALRFFRPLEHGVIKDTDEDLEAAKELIKYAIKLIHPEKYKKVYAVIGAPSQAKLQNHQSILDAAREIIDAVTIVSEPFSVAYGEANIYNTLVIDIGAGTTDICRLKGTMPTEEDQISLIKAGDYIDNQLIQSIANRVKGAQITKDMARRWKENHSFVMKSTKAVVVEITVEGKPLHVDITNCVQKSCEAIVEDLVAASKSLISTFDPEFQMDLKQNIILAGGGSLIRNLDKLLAFQMSNMGQVLVKKVPNPIEAGARGALALAMDLTDEYWRGLVI